MIPTEPDAPERTARSADSGVPEPAQTHSASSILLDSEGIRPIWRVALFLILWELIRQFIFPLFEALFPPSSASSSLITAHREFAFESAALLSVAIATWLMAKLESRSFNAYGFAPQQGLRNFFTGLATGAALLSSLIAALRTCGLLIFDGRLLFGNAVLRAGLMWTAGFLLVAFAEEMLLRGYLQFTITRVLNPLFGCILPPLSADRAGFSAAAIILSIAFGYGHNGNPGESPLGLINAALIGLVFCLSLWRTGSLWWAIGFHAAWDWAQSFLYGVADSGLMVQGHLFATHPVGRPILSGGLTGPEGSILLFAILPLACAAIFLTLPRTPRPAPVGARTAAALDLA